MPNVTFSPCLYIENCFTSQAFFYFSDQTRAKIHCELENWENKKKNFMDKSIARVKINATII